MSISSSSDQKVTSPSHIDGDEQTSLSTSDWSVWDLDLLDILTVPGAPVNHNVDTTTIVTNTWDRGTHTCGWDNNSGSNGSTEIQTEILACVRRILSRMSPADTTTATINKDAHAKSSSLTGGWDASAKADQLPLPGRKKHTPSRLRKYSFVDGTKSMNTPGNMGSGPLRKTPMSCTAWNRATSW